MVRQGAVLRQRTTQRSVESEERRARRSRTDMWRQGSLDREVLYPIPTQPVATRPAVGEEVDGPRRQPKQEGKRWREQVDQPAIKAACCPPRVAPGVVLSEEEREGWLLQRETGAHEC